VRLGQDAGTLLITADVRFRLGGRKIARKPAFTHIAYVAKSANIENIFSRNNFT